MPKAHLAELQAMKAEFPYILRRNEANEHYVRAFLMEFWTKKFEQRRIETLLELEKAKDKATKAKLKRSRYYKSTHPVDLSGACKLVAPFTHIVFDLPGKPVSNFLHSFVFNDATGEVIDLNRFCRDVLDIKRTKNPYEYDPEFSDKATPGLASWNPTIKRLLKKLAKELENDFYREQRVVADRRTDPRARVAVVRTRAGIPRGTGRSSQNLATVH